MLRLSSGSHFEYPAPLLQEVKAYRNPTISISCPGWLAAGFGSEARTGGEAPKLLFVVCPSGLFGFEGTQNTAKIGPSFQHALNLLNQRPLHKALNLQVPFTWLQYFP